MRGIGHGHDQPAIALTRNVNSVSGHANLLAGADCEPVSNGDKPVAAHVGYRPGKLVHERPVEGDGRDDAAHGLSVQGEGNRSLQGDARVRASDALAVQVEDHRGRLAGESFDRRAVVREERALKHLRGGEVVCVRGGILGERMELVLRGLHLRGESRVRAGMLVPESVRVEDAHRRDDGDPGGDEKTGEQLQAGAPRQVWPGLSPRRGLWLGRRSC